MFTPTFYRTFEIPKARGGLRRIDAPNPTLLYVQRWIADNILSAVRLSKYTHGFVEGKSIITNASVHLEARCILKTDIIGFFPSISLPRILAIFRFLGYTPKVSYYLAALCSLNGSLPQGSSASPRISNIVATPLDRRLGAISLSYGLNFSRYADDLTFSGDYIPLNFSEIVKVILEEEGFALNLAKTKLIRGPGRRIVTGISIGSGRLKLPKSSRRKLRLEMFLLERNGIMSQSERDGKFDPLYIDRLLGKFTFWRSLEPGNKFVLEKIEILRNMMRSDVR